MNHPAGSQKNDPTPGFRWIPRGFFRESLEGARARRCGSRIRRRHQRAHHGASNVAGEHGNLNKVGTYVYAKRNINGEYVHK